MLAIVLLILPSAVGFVLLQADYESWRRDQEDRMRRDRAALARQWRRRPAVVRHAHVYNDYGEIINS